MKNRRGVNNTNVRLSNELVYVIRNLYQKGSITQKELAATFGVTQSQVSRIVSGSRWSHIKSD